MKILAKIPHNSFISHWFLLHHPSLLVLGGFREEFSVSRAAFCIFNKITAVRFFKRAAARIFIIS
jgi:hypothetical protein